VSPPKLAASLDLITGFLRENGIGGASNAIYERMDTSTNISQFDPLNGGLS
jgi:hypothetical protein